jgi:hypothetical protein
MSSWTKRWGKIKEFKRVCGFYQFTERQRAILDEINTELDRLVQIRNWIVHGTTYEIGKTRDDAQPYRIGKTMGDSDPINRFVTDFSAPYGFTVQRLVAVTKEFEVLKGKLANLTSEVIKPMLRPASQR